MMQRFAAPSEMPGGSRRWAVWDAQTIQVQKKKAERLIEAAFRPLLRQCNRYPRPARCACRSSVALSSFRDLMNSSACFSANSFSVP